MKLFFKSAKICEICGLKRSFDLAMASFLLCFLSVPILVVGLMVKLTSKGSALYWSDRMGNRRQRSVVSGQRTANRTLDGWMIRMTG